MTVFGLVTVMVGRTAPAATPRLTLNHNPTLARHNARLHCWWLLTKGLERLLTFRTSSACQEKLIKQGFSWPLFVFLVLFC